MLLLYGGGGGVACIVVNCMCDVYVYVVTRTYIYSPHAHPHKHSVRTQNWEDANPGGVLSPVVVRPTGSTFNSPSLVHNMGSVLQRMWEQGDWEGTVETPCKQFAC